MMGKEKRRIFIFFFYLEKGYGLLMGAGKGRERGCFVRGCLGDLFILWTDQMMYTEWRRGMSLPVMLIGAEDLLR